MPTAKNALTYEQAMRRLSTIVADMEQGTLELDELVAQLAEAKKLITFCRSKLTKVENDINKILEDNGKE